MNYEAFYRRSIEDRDGFWAEQARLIDWQQPPQTICDYSRAPFVRWFVGGTTNLCHNAVDRHLARRGDQAALIHVSTETGAERVYSFRELHAEVQRMAAVLQSLGVEQGDRVLIYMPMIPEAVFAMLACVRLGAIHSVVFGGFASVSLASRIDDAEPRVVVSADAGSRAGKVVPYKPLLDEAIRLAQHKPERVLLVDRGLAPMERVAGRDADYAPLREQHLHAQVPCVWVAADHPSYTLYTSGTTGRPKGIIHTTGGYLTHVYITTKLIFDLKEEDTYWCTADIGWVTGHSYIVYGPLANGATSLMYEGAPDYPDKDRFWAIVEKYRVNILYTAPTAIRSFMRWGEQYPQRHDLSSLRLLGTVGEPINPEAWVWYWRHIGGGRCPIVDTWWQTETGGILITPLPGIVTLKPGSATLPFPGVEAEVVDERGNPVPPGQGGYLVLTRPWPGMLRGIYGDHQRYQQTYWSRYPGLYFTGDGAKRDEDGFFWLLGRVDDVIKVSAHRLSTMEIESALVDHPAVAEAAAIGKSHEVKGEAVVVFVTLKEGVKSSIQLAEELRSHVAKKIGAIARPDQVIFTAALPKTRSGKIMRRLLRDIAEGRALGDVTTLESPAVVEALKERYGEEREG